MEQNQELARIKAVIRGLSNKTVANGCTEQEAMLAFEKMSDLLRTYQLSMSDVELRQEKCKDGFYDTNMQRRDDLDRSAMALASFCGVKCWVSHVYNAGQFGKGSVKINAFGMDSDVDIFVYLLGVIHTTMKQEATSFKFSPAFYEATKTSGYSAKSSSKRALSSFKFGFINRINTRLLQMKREKDEAMAKMYEGKTGTSLVVLKNQIVEEEFSKLNMRFRKVQSAKRKINGQAYKAGGNAGDKVNLNRPIGCDTSKSIAGLIGR